MPVRPEEPASSNVTEPSPSKAETKKEEENEALKSDSKVEGDSNYIGPQVPPDMAKKLGLNVDTSAPTTSATDAWKAHVGAKKKSEKQANENAKKSEETRSDFMIPPVKDDAYKGNFCPLLNSTMHALLTF